MSYDNLYWGDNWSQWIIQAPAQLKSDSDLFHPTSDRKYPLGAICRTRDNRWFRYCQDSGTGISKARMACAYPPNANTVNIVQTGYAHSIGDKQFNILLTTSNGTTASCYRDGYLWVNQGASGTIGDMYIVKDNYWTTSDTVLNIEIADQGGLRTAIAASDEITILRNICREVKVNPTTQDACVVGVPLEDVTASYYFWAQFRGVCPLIGDASDTIIVGAPVGKADSAGTAGACGVVGSDGTDCVWGTAICVAETAQSTPDVILVNLMIP